MSNQAKTVSPEMERVMAIALDHIWFAERFPSKVKEAARDLGISTQSALALAIADEVCEAFRLTER